MVNNWVGELMRLVMDLLVTISGRKFARLHVKAFCGDFISLVKLSYFRQQ